MFEPKKSHPFVDLDELIPKMHTGLGFVTIFHKINRRKLEKILCRNIIFILLYSFCFLF